MSDKIQSTLALLPFLPRTLRLAWAAAGRWTAAWILVLLVQGVLPGAMVYTTRFLVDSLTTTIGSGSWSVFQQSLPLALLLGGLMLLSQILQGVQSWIHTVQAELIKDYLANLIHDKSAVVDLAFYESPEYHDQLHRARTDSGNLPLSLLENLGNLLQSGVTLISMGAILIPYGAWLPLALGISTLPVFYVVLHNHRLYHRWWEQTTVDQRRAMYYDFALTIDWMAAEVRLYDLKEFFKQAYQEARRDLREGLFRLTRRQNLTQIGAGLLSLVVTAGVMALMAWRAMLGLVTLGDLVLLYQAFNQGQGLLRSLLSNVGQVYRNTLFLRNLFEFLDLDPYVLDPPTPASMPERLQQGIRFRNVTFCYPGSNRVALQNFNLDIPAGRTVAIVGANGAGKSTLVKLLCRFYDPEQGAVELDGVDIRRFNQRSLRDQLSVMFQDPVEYHATAAENIAMGQRSQAQNRSRIEQAAAEAGAHRFIASLPDGYNTMLNKWFEPGTALSGGEWQRVALARAFLRRTEIIILDEPTSAMDSWAEAEWLDRFKQLVKGRTAVVITHRFTTAMRADIIHVMDQGHIVESGSHQELLAQGGLYAQSWRTQIQQSGEMKAETPSQNGTKIEKSDVRTVT